VAEVLDRKAQSSAARAPPQRRLVLVAEAGRGSLIRGLRKRRRRITPATSTFTTKPGYGSVRTFLRLAAGSVSLTGKIHARTHVGAGFEVAWTSSLALEPAPTSFLELARARSNGWRRAHDIHGTRPAADRCELGLPGRLTHALFDPRIPCWSAPDRKSESGGMREVFIDNQVAEALPRSPIR